jgi:hypothetical protein
MVFATTVTAVSVAVGAVAQLVAVVQRRATKNQLSNTEVERAGRRKGDT